MQCGELVYCKVPIISNTDNTTNNLTSNMLGNINTTMSISSNSIIKPQIKSEKETIHSGHFMVSHFEAEEQDDEDELAVPVPDAEQISGKLTIVGVTPAGINAQAFINANVNDRSNKNELSIETSLTKLFQCMSLAYRQKLTSPKWNRFKGIRLRWKDKIRLNNVIWRCWHMQFIMKQNTLVCQFASPLDVDTHNKPEAVVLEGKYWKRRLAAVTAEYKKWRLFHRNRVLGCNKDGSDVLSEMDMLDWQPNSEEGNHMMVDEDYMDFMADTLFSTIQSNQPFAFPDSREIARAGLADFIQPSLGPLQPNLEDFMDTFEPLQEFISSSKLAPVPEEPSNEDMFRSNFVGLDLMPTESQQQQQPNRISPMILQQQTTSVVPTLPSSQQQQTVVQQFIPPLKLELTEQQYNADISQQINNLYEQATNLQQQQQNLQQEEANIQQQQISIVSQPTTTRCHQPRNSRSIQRSSKLNQRQQNNAIQQQQQVLQQPNTVQSYQQMTTNYNQSYENLQQETSTYQNYQTIDMSTGNTTVNIRQQSANNNNNPSRLQDEPFKMPQSSQSLMSGGGVLPSTTQQTNQHHIINQQQSKQTFSNIRANQQQQQVVKFQTSSNNFKVPTLPPVNQQQSWSPPPTQQATQSIQQQQQTPQAYSQPVQLIQVSDLNILQNNQQLKTTGAGNATLSSMANVNKYTSIKQRGRVRSLSVGPRQPPPPLKSSASDPALLSNTNSVLLAHLLTNNTQTVYNFNSSTNTNEKTNLLQSGSVVTSNIKNSSNNIPILSVPSQPSTTTTLLISTPVQLPLEVQSPLSLPQNQIILNSIGPNTNLPTNSPKSVTNESPLSPLSPAESLGSPSMRNADRSPGPRDSRRVVHIHAEQKRRYNIKNGFDTLHSLIPQLSQNPNAKLSKAAMLQKGAEYIRQLKAERSQLKEEMDNLRQQIECLNTSISNCQSMLPATGAPVSRQRASKMREMFDEYVRNRTEENWKFWIFSFLFEPLLSSFNSSVSTSSLDDLYRSTLLWIEQHCSLVDLRPAVLNNLRVLSTKTDILSDPSKLPDEARQAAAATKNLRISSHHHHNQ